MSATQERLDALKELPANWDTYGALKPDPVSIDYAKTWIATHQQECGEKWIDPSGIFPMGWTEFEHEVCFEWYVGKRTLNLCVNSKEASGLQIWDSTDPQCRIDDCEANTPEERAVLWAWLTKVETELDLAGALQAMNDFEKSMHTLQTSAGTPATDIAGISDGILRLAEGEEA